MKVQVEKADQDAALEMVVLKSFLSCPLRFVTEDDINKIFNLGASVRQAKLS